MKYHEYVYKMLDKHAPPKVFDSVVKLPVFRFTGKDLQWLDKYPEETWPSIVTEIFDSILDSSYLDILPFKHLLVVLDEGIYDLEFMEDCMLLNHYTTEEQQRGFPGIKYFWVSTRMDEFVSRDPSGINPIGAYYSSVSAICICQGRNKLMETTALAKASFSGEVLEAFEEQLEMDRRTITQILKVFMEADARHLVQVNPKRDPRGNTSHHRKRHQWKARVPKHHYIYLDAPPSDLMPTHSSTGKPLTTGHKRRAHWRTLRAVRYRKHPNYLKKIRIREAWIGPKTWSDSGAVYTIIDRTD